jgi:hypothetical protein
VSSGAQLQETILPQVFDARSVSRASTVRAMDDLLAVMPPDCEYTC